ncbi:hypothetical protein SNEBB_008198 [Seison nebaliae]|nr:hypothetical protein SNEBB_008198 [Seison nebaliae]
MVESTRENNYTKQIKILSPLNAAYASSTDAIFLPQLAPTGLILDLPDEWLLESDSNISIDSMSVTSEDKHNMFHLFEQTRKHLAPTLTPNLSKFICYTNYILPGIGTLISAFASFGDKKLKKEQKCCKNCERFFNLLLLSLVQIILIPMLGIGWLWSINYGTYVRELSKEYHMKKVKTDLDEEQRKHMAIKKFQNGNDDGLLTLNILSIGQLLNSNFSRVGRRRRQFNAMATSYCRSAIDNPRSSMESGENGTEILNMENFLESVIPNISKPSQRLPIS